MQAIAQPVFLKPGWNRVNIPCPKRPSVATAGSAAMSDEEPVFIHLLICPHCSNGLKQSASPRHARKLPALRRQLVVWEASESRRRRFHDSLRIGGRCFILVP